MNRKILALISIPERIPKRIPKQWTRHRLPFLSVFIFLTGFMSCSSPCELGRCKNSTGIKNLENGDQLIAQFENDDATGAGIIKYKNGDRYMGELKDGLPRGVGILITAGGKRIYSQFRNGKPLGLAVIRPDDEGTGVKKEERYYGRVRNISKQGPGILLRPDQFSFIGRFHEDRPAVSQWAISIRAGGDIFMGEMRDRRPQGYGVRQNAAGEIRYGYWEGDDLKK